MSVAGYKIRVNGGSLVDHIIDVGNVLTFDVDILEGSTNYTFEVASYDAAGNQSDWSAPISGTTPTAPDPDVTAYLTATGITDPTISAAFFALVATLKAASLWPKFYAIYPFPGTTAAINKFNLKDPRDLDAAYRGTFSGSVTHNANGVTWNGTDGYMDTHINGSTVLSKTNMSWGIYSRTNNPQFRSEWGGLTGAGIIFDLSGSLYHDIPNMTDRFTPANAITDGLLVGSLGASDVVVYWNGNSIGSKGSAATQNFANENVLVGQGTFGFSNYNHAFAFFGQNLTAAEVAILYAAIETFQTALGRNKYDPPSLVPHLRVDAGSNTTQGRWSDQRPYLSGSGSNDDSGTTGIQLNAPIRPGRTQHTNVYRTARKSSGTITFTVAGLTPSTNCKVRIHAHDYGDGAGVYKQSIKANGTTVISSYDVRTFAGGSSVIGIKEFTALADGSGQIVIDIIPDSTFQAIVSSLEVHQPTTAVDYRKAVFAGDSITWGSTLVDETHSWPCKIAASISGGGSCIDKALGTYIRAYDETYRWTIHKLAEGGKTFQDILSWQSTYVNPYDDPLNTKQIIFFLAGVNDMEVYGRSNATIETDITNCFNAVPAGWIKGIGTLLPNNFTEPLHTQCLDLSTWIRANSLGFDFVVDWTNLDTRFNDPNDTTYYADGIHPTDALTTIMAGIMTPIIAAL